MKARPKDGIAEKRDRLKRRIMGARSRAGEASPDPDQVKQGARRAAGIAQENPLGLALGSVAAASSRGCSFRRRRSRTSGSGRSPTR